MSVVYLDSYDELRKVKAGYTAILENKPSERRKSFVNVCKELQLPLNEGKRLVGAVHGLLQGGELDGLEGTFEASHDKKVSILSLACALLGAGEATEFELRHFVGKAIFAMAFRRPTMSLLEHIFVDIGKSIKGKIQLNRRTLDEIIMVVAVLPLLKMNLRAQLDREVTVTDASPTGGGGAVSSSFKDPPDTTRHDGRDCHYCKKPLQSTAAYPCPSQCGVGLCSLRCVGLRRDGPCKRRRYVVPKFGERFSGPNAPLTHAVAKGGAIEVQPPYDLRLGDDFFTPEGKEKLDSLEADPALVAEHWAPECKLFSKARGKPVRLPDGKVVAGPQPVRDRRRVMGFPWVHDQMKGRLRRSNKMALRGLKRAKSTFGKRRFVTIEHPYGSWMWGFILAKELAEEDYQYEVGSNCCFGGDRVKWYGLLNNCEGIHEEVNHPYCPGHPGLLGYEASYNPDGSLHFATEEEAEYKPLWCQAYARGLRKHLEDLGWIQQSLVQGRARSIIKELEQATARLSHPDNINFVATEVAELEKNMAPGMERQHLRRMIRMTSIRGTDLRLMFGDNGIEVPYPAYRWLWQEVLSYKWREERRINEGELAAFNVMLRRRTRNPKKHEMRYLAILDSLVTRGAVSKGRSPSKGLNRLLKQTCALLLGSDQYPLATWTISRWNFADGASRRR